MYKLKSLDIASVALYSFLMYFILGLIIFLPFGFIFTLFSNFLPHTDEFNPSFVLPAFTGVIIFLIPIFYSVLGTIMNVIVVIIYNLLSKKIGGLKIELVEENI